MNTVPNICFGKYKVERIKMTVTRNLTTRGQPWLTLGCMTFFSIYIYIFQSVVKFNNVNV